MGSRCVLGSNWDHLLEKWAAADCEGKFAWTLTEHDSELLMELCGEYCLCTLRFPPLPLQLPESRHYPSFNVPSFYHSI